MSSATALLPRTSAQLAALINDETGSGALVFGTNPTLTGANLAGDISGNGFQLQQMGNIELGDTSKIKPLSAGGSQFFITAYDVDGAVDVTFITLTSDNIPACDLSTSVTMGGDPIIHGLSPTLNNLTLSNGGALRTDVNNGNQLLLRAYDVDGGFYRTFMTLQAGNTPSCNLDTAVTIDGAEIYRVGGTDVALADGGTGVSLSDPNADRIMFWDDSAGQMTWLQPGSDLTINGTTIAGVSGTYTPTFTNVANVASFGTVSDATYSRNGNTVTVSGRVSIDPTSASVNTQFRMSLPIASNFNLFTDVGGTFAAKDSVSISGAIVADTANDEANFQYINTAETGAKDFSYCFQYNIK